MANNQQLRDEINELKSDLDGLRADVSTIARTLRQNSGEQVDEMRDSVRDEIRKGRETLKRRVNEARARSRETMGEVEESIGEHPYTSVAAAFGVGFALAKLIELANHRHHH